MTTEVARRLTGRYGVRFVVTTTVDPAIRMPGTARIGLAANTVWLTKDVRMAQVIHETGHVLFGMAGDEGRWLPWEWRVARWLRREQQWRDENYAYGMGWCDFGELSNVEQDHEMRHLLHRAPPVVRRAILRVDPHCSFEDNVRA